MTALGESELLNRINIELDTLLGKFLELDSSLATLLVALTADTGSAVGASLTADLAALNTEADTMLTASA